MGSVEHQLSKGSQRASRIRTELGGDIRRARMEHGLSQAVVARAARVSRSQLSRIERAENRAVSLLVLARLLSVLGMELSARAYPAGQPIRDSAHRVLLDRLRPAVGPEVRLSHERPLPVAGDQRAWDAGLVGKDFQLGVETETRLGDLQALERRVRLKLRDDPTVQGCLLVLADTRHNRVALRAEPDALADFARIGPAELARMTTGGNRLALL